MKIKDVAAQCGWTAKELMIRLNKESGVSVKTANDDFPELNSNSQLLEDIKTAVKANNTEFENQPQTPISSFNESAITETELVEATLTKSVTIQQVLQAATEDTGLQHAQIAGAVGGTRNALAYIQATQGAYQTILENYLQSQFEVTDNLLENAKQEYSDLVQNSQARLSNVYELRRKLEEKRKAMTDICNTITSITNNKSS